MVRRWFAVAGVLAVAVLFVATESSEAARQGRGLGRRSRNGNSQPMASSRQANYPSDAVLETGAVSGNRVVLNIRVPEGAEITFDGERTSQTGTQRQFVSPELAPGQTYSYEITATWMENGKEVSRTRKVDVRAGERQLIDLTQGGQGMRNRYSNSSRESRSSQETGASKKVTSPEP